MGLVIGLLMLGLIFFMIKPTFPTLNLNKLKPSNKTKKIVKYSLAVLGAVYALGLLFLMGREVIPALGSNTQKNTTTTQESLIECYINGAKVMATRTDCATLSKKDTTPAKPITPTQVTPQPTPQPTVVIQQPEEEKEKKKVPVTIEGTGFLTGTFYCYEENANEITKAQSLLDSYKYYSSVCYNLENIRIQQCFNECELGEDCSECEFNENACKRESDDVETYRKLLEDKILEYCP